MWCSFEGSSHQEPAPVEKETKQLALRNWSRAAAGRTYPADGQLCTPSHRDQVNLPASTTWSYLKKDEGVDP